MPELFESDDLSEWETLEEAAPEEGTPAEETVAEEAPAEADTAETAERPRDEKGRFLPADKPEAEEEITTEEASEELLAGKYRTPEDLEKAFVELQRKLGEQGQELGSLRSQFEERLSEFEDEEPEQPTYDASALSEWFQNNPTQIPVVAAEAYRQGNQAIVNAALLEWEDIDRAGAKQFEREMLKEDLRREQEQAYAQQSQATQGWHTVAQQFGESHPDLDKFAPAMREIAGQFPNMLRVLEYGDSSAQIEVLDFLYTKARDRVTDTLAVTQKEVAAQQASDADRAIADAQVASATTTKSEPVGKTAADKIGEEWEAYERPRTDGWKI